MFQEMEHPEINKTNLDETSENITNYQTSVEEVENLMTELRSGKEPILLKIVTGKASEDEIGEWVNENGISSEETSDVLELLMSSFSIGTQLAEKIESNLASQMDQVKEITNSIEQTKNKDGGIEDKTEIISRLDEIVSDLDQIKSRVNSLINALGRSSDETREEMNYSQLL